MNKRCLIIITGELAAGKTSYGKRISEKLEIPFFSKDRIKEILYDSLVDENLEYNAKKKIGASSYDIFYYIIEEQMKTGQAVIAESNFAKESAPILRKLSNKYDYKSITIRFEGDLQVLHKRFLRREYSSERHMGLKANGTDFNSFERYAKKSKEFKIDDNEIVVDTTDFNNVNLEDIIKQIKSRIQNI